MNPHIGELKVYPFERLRRLFKGIEPERSDAINMGIGEPKHATPQLIKDGLVEGFGGLAKYPLAKGTAELRESVSRWIHRRYGVAVDPETSILPVQGSREALFCFAHAYLDHSEQGTRVAMPNPFYQIYEGAALMAGAQPLYLPCRKETNFQPDFHSVSAAEWGKTRLVYTCTPGNPTGAVMTLQDWAQLFELQDKFGFCIASDECYSEIYFGSEPPVGALEAAAKLGRSSEKIVMFSSLSKRSNAPGLRSGFVAGDPAIMEKFAFYRTYHGNAMSEMTQHASALAWDDEAHVVANRAAYQEKFHSLTPKLADVLDVDLPDAAFFLWARVRNEAQDGLSADEWFARELYRKTNVTVLPGTYIGRDVPGGNPGEGYVRLALVAEIKECSEAVNRILDFCASV